jgi:hypothetical protein
LNRVCHRSSSCRKVSQKWYFVDLILSVAGHGIAKRCRRIKAATCVASFHANMFTRVGLCVATTPGLQGGCKGEHQGSVGRLPMPSGKPRPVWRICGNHHRQIAAGAGSEPVSKLTGKEAAEPAGDRHQADDFLAPFARDLGVNSRTDRNWLNGKRPIDRDVFIRTVICSRRSAGRRSPCNWRVPEICAAVTTHPVFRLQPFRRFCNQTVVPPRQADLGSRGHRSQF